MDSLCFVCINNASDTTSGRINLIKITDILTMRYLYLFTISLGYDQVGVVYVLSMSCYGTRNYV